MWWITSAFATTWSIPGDFANLQEAFDSSTVVTGDTIELGAGSFEGATLTNGKMLEVSGVGATTIVTLSSGTDGVVFSVAASTLELSDLVVDGQGNHAGLYANALADVTVRDATFLNGKDRSDPDPAGGACLTVDDATAVVENTTFTGCQGLSGAGGALRARSGAVLIVQSSTIDANSSLGAGGAIKVDNGAFLSLENTTVSNNAAANGGGASADGEISILGGEFSGNEATLSGGALHSVVATAVVTVDGTRFLNNLATSGGAVSGSGNTTLERVWIEGNSASNGGALATTGPLFVRNAYACGNTATGEGHVIDAGPDTLDLANVLSIGNGTATGVTHSLDGFVRHSAFLLEDGSPIVRVEAGTFADNLVVSDRVPEPVGLNVVGGIPTVDNNLVFGASIASSFDTLPLTDDPLLVVTGTDCSDLWTTYATNVVDRGALFLTDPDGTVADIGHLGGPDVDALWWGADADGDGSLVPSDCDDNNPDRYPTAEEICDGIDNDCDFFVDDADSSVTATIYYFDGDGDGWAADATSATPYCSPPSDYVTRVGDCDDINPAINFGAIEACPDNLDNDCDGLIDAADPDYTAQAVTLYFDGDQDGVGVDTNSLQACSGAQPVGFVPATLGVDCDDTNPVVSPIEAEICDAFDNNCDGTVNEGFLTSPYYPDVDGDGYGATLGVMLSCSPIQGMVNNDDDCDDTNPDINPTIPEICDGIDQNCSGDADDGLPTTTWYIDADSDGYGDIADPGTPDCATLSGHTSDASDCDDTDGTINPGAAEIPDDGIDNDCMGGDFVTPVLDSDGDGIPDPFDPAPQSDGDVTGSKPGIEFGCGCRVGSAPGASLFGLVTLLAIRRRRLGTARSR